MGITITNGTEPLMWVDGDQVMIPTDENERAACMIALSDALSLLAETAQASSISSKAIEMGEALKQSSPHLGDCLEACENAPPSGQSRSNREHGLRLVSSDLRSPES